MARRRDPRTYVALVRGINVGGRKRVAMADLRRLFEDLDAEDVRTYVQSGNVVFGSREPPNKLVRAVEEGIRRSLGLDVSVLVKTREQLAKIVEGNPFLAAGADPAKLHVTFLAAEPAPRRIRGLDPKRFEPDEFRVAGQEIYLHCPNGYGRTKLSNTFFERELAVAATTRNWKTVTTLAELANA